MTLALQDRFLRLMVLTQLVARLHRDGADELLKAGVEPHQIDRLRTLDPSDIHRLAALPHPMVELTLDGGSMNSCLRRLAAIKDAQFLEDYFILHGASPRMMKALFTLPLETTRARRQKLGLKRLFGRPVLPAIDVRDRIHRFWAAHAHLDTRTRYYQMHRAFPAFRFDTLDSVIIEYERNKK